MTKTGVVSVLHTFQGGFTDGLFPTTGLAHDAMWNLYGTAPGNNPGNGVVFKLTPSGEETILYKFTGGLDGMNPSKVALDSAGNIYGTAQGGVNGSEAGLAFKLDTSNTFSVLYNFCSLPSCIDGELPTSGPILDQAGNLYGVTDRGGSGDSGTVYKITPSGVETVLHSFIGFPGDGAEPRNNLRQDAQGNLYGVTLASGANNRGVLFKQPETGGAETVLYNFCTYSQCTDGQYPIGPVQIDKAGNLYGIAFESAVNRGPVVWELNTAGKEIVLFTFGKDVEVLAGLTIDSGGNLYGVTYNGGASHLGSVFKLKLLQ